MAKVLCAFFVASMTLTLGSTVWAITSDGVYSRISSNSQKIVDKIKEENKSRDEICKGMAFIKELAWHANTTLIADQEIGPEKRNMKGAVKYFKFYCRGK